MEVFVRNLPDQATEKQINGFFCKVLETLGIKTYHCQKLKRRGLATITILDVGKARNFLRLYGRADTVTRSMVSFQQRLQFMGKFINCSQSRNAPDHYLLLTLKKEESDRYAAQSRKPKIVPARVNGPGNKADEGRAFDILTIDCGQWTYRRDELVFATYHQEQRYGRIIFGDRILLINLWSQTQDSLAHQVEIPYNSIQSFTIGPKSEPSITFSLSEAPKFYRKLVSEEANTEGSELENSLNSMILENRKQTFTRSRTTALSTSHGSIVSSCLCYRVKLRNAKDVDGLRGLKKYPAIPDSISWNTSAVREEDPFTAQMTKLKSLLASKKYGEMPFEVKFQLQKLAQNGYLEPLKVVELIPFVDRRLRTTTNAGSIVQALRNLSGYLPFAGPDTEASELNVETLAKYLSKSQESILHGDSYSVDLAEQYDHIASVHKAMVTPTGIYLYGPDPETKNRVLRKYSAFPNYFLSVSFGDEDGQSLWLDRQTSGTEIYHGRFKGVLEGIINIAGRGYEVSES